FAGPARLQPRTTALHSLGNCRAERPGARSRTAKLAHPAAHRLRRDPGPIFFLDPACTRTRLRLLVLAGPDRFGPGADGTIGAAGQRVVLDGRPRWQRDCLRGS